MTGYVKRDHFASCHDFAFFHATLKKASMASATVYFTSLATSVSERRHFEFQNHAEFNLMFFFVKRNELFHFRVNVNFCILSVTLRGCGV